MNEQALKSILDEIRQQHREELRIQQEAFMALLNERQPLPHADEVSQKVKNLADQMVTFEYDPENNNIFESYYNRYESLFNNQAAGLQEPTKVQLLLQKFQQKDYQKFADSILPKKAHELTLLEAVKELKRLFGYKETKFSMRHKCFSLVKQEDEDFIQYAALINKHAEKFDVGNCSPDDLKVLLFISGLKNSKDSIILEKLLTKVDNQYVQIEAALTEEARAEIKKLTLQELVNEAQRIICLKHDKVKVGEPLNSPEINYVQRKSFKNRYQNKNSNHDEHQLPWNPCPGCGGTHWLKDCSFQSKQCPSCKEVGHKPGYCTFMKKRSSKGNSSSNQVQSTVNSLTERKFVEPHINGAAIKLQLDTGSDMTIISLSNWKKLGEPVLKPAGKSVKSASGGSIPLKGSFPCNMKLNNTEKQGEVFVSTLQLNLFGIDWIEKFDLWSKPIDTICNNIHSSKTNDIITEIKTKFPQLFSEGLGCCSKTKASFSLKPESKPTFRNARPVPQAARAPIAAELERLQHLGIITPIAFSEWAAPIVAVKKKNGKIRICGDYSTGLNEALEPNKYPLPTPDQIFAKLAGKKVFSKIDLTDAYFQVESDDNAKELMTINTHCGLFSVNRLQQGIKTAPGIFQQIVDTMLSGTSTFGFIDDMITAGVDEEDHKEQLLKTLERIQDFNFKLRIDKCEFARNAVDFCGFIVDSKGIRPHPDKIREVINMPRPTDISLLRSFLGAANYYGKFIKSMKEVRGPLDNLLKKDVKYEWQVEHDKAFNKLKKIIASDLVLTHFDPCKKIVLATDASKFGMGAVIMHRYDDGMLHPIMHFSATFNTAEQNYSQIEKEARALIFGLKRSHFYIYGRKFTIHIDHKPLLAIFGSKTGIPVYTASRLQRWALIVMAYDFKIEYINTDSFGYADVVSRLMAKHVTPDEETIIANLKIDTETDEDREEEMLCYAIKTAHNLPITFTDVQEATRECQILKKVMQFITNDSWPQKKIQIKDPGVAAFFEGRDGLKVHQECIFSGERIVIPLLFRKQILDELHQGHPGETRMKLLASTKLYWPNINKDIEATVKTCEKCAITGKSPIKCSLQTWPMPRAPWMRIHMDYAGPIDGYFFLVIVDAFSKWPEIFKTGTTTAAKTIELFAEVICRQGLCDVCVTDNGPQFVSKEFENFCKTMGIAHVKTAPYSPQSNGQAERFVDLFKLGLKKAEGNIDHKVREFLKCYRFTPSYNLGSKSPFELMTGRPMKIKLDLLKPKITETLLRNKQMEQTFNQQHGAKWRSFDVGDKVYYQLHSSTDNWKWAPAIINDKLGAVNYQLEVSVADGTRLIRAHANQLKRRHDKNEFNELFEIPDFNSDKTDEVEPIIIPQQTNEIENHNQSDVFEDAQEECQEEIPEAQNEIQLRRSDRSTKGVPPKRYQEVLRY